jgi:hypothetical protein
MNHAEVPDQETPHMNFLGLFRLRSSGQAASSAAQRPSSAAIFCGAAGSKPNRMTCPQALHLASSAMTHASRLLIDLSDNHEHAAAGTAPTSVAIRAGKSSLNSPHMKAAIEPVISAPVAAVPAIRREVGSEESWCRPESGWNSVWRILRSHEGIVSGGEVNWLINGFCGERLPAIDLAHVDLS